MEKLSEYMPLSPDWNEERLEALKKMFPDLFTNEGKLNTEELKKLADPQGINETERYEFRWFGKSQAKRNAFTPSNATLVFDEKRSVNSEQSENLIIEGENLEVLKLLSNAYREKIKCIYIDPPYNTGKDFVYSDNFSQDRKAYWEDAGVTEEGVKIDTNSESDGRYHSNWLNMMYSRLLIARQLLKEDGVIFISIDDNEIHHLRKLCDEVFGEENFVSEFIWEKKKKPSFLHKNVGKLTEYILCYVKDSSKTFPFSVETTEEGKKTPINNAGNSLSTLTFPPNSVNFNISDGIVKCQDMSEGNILTKLLKDVEIKNGKNINDLVLQGEWRYSQQTINEIISNDDEIRISKIPFRPNHIKSGGEIKKMKNIFSPTHYQMQTNEDSTEHLINLFNGVDIFDNPKPYQLIELIIRAVTYDDKDAIVLDFFSGSGSTGEAVLRLNIQDEGNRKFLLIQLPEVTDEKSEAYKEGYKKISDITIERNKRVIDKLIEEKKNQQLGIFNDAEQPTGLGFKVFQLTKSKFPRVEWKPEPDKTEAENIEALKKYISEKEAQLVTMFNREELTTEILLKKGYNLNYTTQRQEQFKDNEVYLATDGKKETLICLDAIMHENTVEHLKTHTEHKFICLERALDTTKKWNLKHSLGDKLQAF